MLNRKAIAHLTDFVVKHIWRHYDLEHLIDMMDLDPSEVAPGLSSSSSIEARVKSFFFNISNDLNKIIEFLNLFLKKYRNSIKGDEVENIKPWLESCGITIVADEEGYIAKLITPIETAGESIYEDSLLSSLLPESVLRRLEEAIEQYGNGRFDFVMTKCRTSLEALAKENGYGTDFRRMIEYLRRDGKIRESEEKLLKKLYGYLSSFEAIHAASKPNKFQAFYALNLTKHTLLFLVNII